MFDQTTISFHTQHEFYMLLRRHAAEWNRAYNKTLTYKRNFTLAVRWLEWSEYYNGLADRILNMTRADFKRWQWFHNAEFGMLYFKLIDLYGKPVFPAPRFSMPVSKSIAQLPLF